MTFEQAWTVIRKRWILIIGCCLLIGLGALLGSKLLKPLYQSSLIVQVMLGSSNINQANYDGLLASQQLAQTEATLATSSSVLNVVASHHHGLTASQLAAEVSATPKTNTSLFEIDVVDPKPFMAATLANDIAATLIEQQAQTTQQTNTLALQQIQTHLTQLTTQINDTTTQIAQLQAKINDRYYISNPDDKTQLALLQTQLNNAQQSYNAWQASLIQLQLTETQNGNPLSVIQSALPSNDPVQPNVKLNTGGGLVAGLLLGLLLALLVDRLDTRVRTPEEFTQVLGWPALATIWRVKASQAEKLINPTSNDINVEQFRIMRTNIGFASIDKPLRSLLVTSASPQEGKSSIAAKLAIFMARAGKNTLLIDADLRRPFQHTLFKLIPHTPGLSNAILAFSATARTRTLGNKRFEPMQSPLEQQKQQGAAYFSLAPFAHAVGIPNLRVMPAGSLPPNPSEFLASKPMQRFLAMLEKSSIEIIILDTPPLLGLSDTSILAPMVDGALVVIDATLATRKKLEQMKRTLTQTGVQVPGYVANKLKHTRADETYRYYMEGQTAPDRTEELMWHEKQPVLTPDVANLNQLPLLMQEPENEEPWPALVEEEVIDQESTRDEAETPQISIAQLIAEEASNQEPPLQEQEQTLPPVPVTPLVVEPLPERKKNVNKHKVLARKAGTDD